MHANMETDITIRLGVYDYKVTIFQKLEIGTFHRGRHNFPSRPSKEDSVNRLGSLNISKFSGLYHFKLLIWPMVNLYQQCLKAVNIKKNM